MVTHRRCFCHWAPGVARVGQWDSGRCDMAYDIAQQRSFLHTVRHAALDLTIMRNKLKAISYLKRETPNRVTAVTGYQGRQMQEALPLHSLVGTNSIRCSLELSLPLLPTPPEEGTSIQEAALFLISPGHSQHRRRDLLRGP